MGARAGQALRAHQLGAAQQAYQHAVGIHHRCLAEVLLRQHIPGMRHRGVFAQGQGMGVHDVAHQGQRVARGLELGGLGIGSHGIAVGRVGPRTLGSSARMGAHCWQSGLQVFAPYGARAAATANGRSGHDFAQVFHGAAEQAPRPAIHREHSCPLLVRGAGMLASQTIKAHC